MKTLVCLVGGQMAPNLFSVKINAPERVILVHTDQTKVEAERLNYQLLHYYGINSSSLEEVSAFALDQIIASAAAIFEKNPDVETVNYTGATKPMSLGFATAATLAGLELEYIDTQNNTVYKTKNGTTTAATLAVKADVQEILFMKGAIVESWKSKDDIKPYIKLCLEIFNLKSKNDKGLLSLQKDLKKYVNVNERELSESLKRWHGTFQIGIVTVVASIGQNDDGLVSVLLDGELVAENTKSFWAHFFVGTWFEYLVFYELMQLNYFDDLRANIVIGMSKGDAKGLIKNEIDVCGVKNGIPYFIECKAGDVTQNEINKLAAISDIYGPTVSKRILVMLYNFRSEVHKERCQDLQIKTITNVAFSLKNLKVIRK